MSFTPRVIYKKKECLAGQVIRTNITDEGIFRVFYNDVSGNMFSSVSRQSNYKQVIINSARDRTIFDVSNTEVNNFNSPFYGGTYHMNEISGNYVSTNDYSGVEITGFYTLQYNNNEDSIAHAGPWHMFSEPQLQSYIKQGDSSGNIYDTRGYSDILLDRNQILNPILGPGYAAFPWANQFLYFFAISQDPGINNNVLSSQYPGINEVGTGVPDLWHFMNQTTIGGENPGVLNNFFTDSNIVNPTTTGLYLTTGPYGGVGDNLVGNTFRSSNYYFSSASPKYVWLDANNNATPDASGNPMNQQSDYYKGNFLIWVDTSGNADTSGNVYLGRKNRTVDYFDFSYNVIDHFTNYADPSGTEDISNVFVDIDIDVSRNAINENFNYIYSKPYFVACSDASSNIVVGRAPYDVSYNSINDIDIINFPPNNANRIAKYCKIKVFQEPNNTNNVIPTPEDASSNLYVCYYNTNKQPPLDDNFGGMIEVAYTQNSNFINITPSSPPTRTNYNDTNKVNILGNGGGYGLYPSMDIDKDGYPRIAFFGRRGTEDNPNNNLAIHLISADRTNPTINDHWEHTLVKDFGTNNIDDLSGAYIDMSNNQPISLKISPFDNSNHIVFQDPKGPNSEYYCVSYWTDSDNIIDITKVDSSLNYLGLHSYGKTIDMSRASVEVYWDLSQSLCLFSRDFRRYDTSENLLVGRTSPLLMAKPYTNPLGGRLNDLGYINKNSSGWNGAVNYRFNEIDKLYIVIDAKLTNDSLGTFESPIRNTLFCLGSLIGEGGFVCGLDKYPVRFGEDNDVYFDTSGSIFMGIKGQEEAEQADGNDTYASAPFQYLRRDISGTPPDAEGFEPMRSNWERNAGFFIPNINESYRYEFYYNKSNSYIEITIKSLDNPNVILPGNATYNGGIVPEVKYCRRNVVTNGGFNIKDGYISIGSDSHSSSNVWNGEIQRVSVYATDISNVPVFDLSRNGEILRDCSSTPFSSFFDISNNEGLQIEPSGNIYQVVNAVNALNVGDISGSSQYKEVMLNDIYYYQRVLNQTVSQQASHPGQYITAFDRFKEKKVNSNYYDLWAIGYTTFGTLDNDILPVVFTSGDGGLSWIKNDSYNLGISGESLLDIKTYKDPSGGRWVYICGENYLLQYTNDYDFQGQPGINPLGVNWYTVDFTNLPYGRKDGTGVANTWGEFAPTQGRKLDINNICIADISKSPFLTDQSSNDFHLWIGTKSYDYTLETEKGSEININFPSGTPWLYEIWWQILDSNNTVILQTSGYGGSYASSSIGPAGAPYNRTLWFPEGSYTILMYDTYGDGWHGGYLTVRDTVTNNVLGSGTLGGGAGPGSFTFTVPSNNFMDYYDYGAFAPSYKDILIRGNQIDYSNNTLDYSYNVITNNILKPENNAITDLSGDIIPTDITVDKIKNESFNTFSFGGSYTTNKDGLNFGIVTTDSFCFTTKDGGEVWDLKLNTDRISLSNTNYPRGSWGSYVEKNQINDGGNYIYDNSGMYIQTSNEPWNGIPGLTLAYNNSEYDLSFSPIDSNRLKSITWDPSLNSTEKFWNVQVPDNDGKPVIWRDGGGNTIKVYIDDEDSTNDYYKYKQKFWTFDSLVHNNNSFIPNNAIEPSLYLRDSELINKWQRINLSIVDPSLNRYNPFYSQRWDSFTDYDCSYALVNLPFIPELNINDSNNYSGFYKLGKIPFQPFVTVTQSLTNLYAATININYKINEVLILKPDEFKERLNFQQLGIYVYYEQKRNPSSSSSVWESITTTNNQAYTQFLPNLAAGSKYIFRARLWNKYGYGWYSNQSIEIEIPSPQPQINKLKIDNTLFTNIVSWDPFVDSFNGIPDVQTVYSYDIEKSYLDLSNNWAVDISFSNFYSDLSGVLREIDGWGDLSGQQWTGPYNPISKTNDLSSVKFMQFADTDLSLNTFYQYKIKCYSLARDKQSSYIVSQQIPNGLPENPRLVHTSNDASLNLIWTISHDISSNTEVTWDISWQEIRDDGSTTHYGEFSYTDPYNGVIGGGGEIRQVSFPLLNNHIQPDATYNAQIQVDYQNNTVVSDYTPSTSQLQTIEYNPNNVFTYYNYLQPPILNNATYIDDTITINWDINKGGTFKDITFYQDSNGAKVNIVKTATSIQNLTVVNEGSGYAVNDVLTILNTDISRDSNLPNLEIELKAADISSNGNSLILNSSLLSSITNGKVVPTTPFNTTIFDLSLSNITANRTDVSYNIYPVEGDTFIDPSGTSYYPGSYNIRVRSAYGDAQNGVVLYSKFSNQLTLSNFIPEHIPKNFRITAYNKLDEITTNDISYVHLTWSPPGIDKYNIDGYPIPKNYKLTRKSNQSGTLDFIAHPLTTDISYIDTNSPIGDNPSVPRIYHYDLDAEY